MDKLWTFIIGKGTASALRLKVKSKVQYFRLIRSSVSDPDPHGSAKRNVYWIRIHMDRYGSGSGR